MNLVKNYAYGNAVIQQLSDRFQLQHIKQPLAFLICGMLISALGISAIGPGHLVAAALCILWAILGVILHIPGALAVLLFAAVQLPAGPEAAIACILLGLGLAFLDIFFSQAPSLPANLRSLRNELRDAEFQQEILHRHIGRYPVLLDSCTLFSNAQELGQLANMLCAQTQLLVKTFDVIGVFFGKGNHIYCAHAINKQKELIQLKPGKHENYVIVESRLLAIREDTFNHIYIPLRGDRRQETVNMQHGLNGVLYIGFQSNGIDDEFIIDILRALGRLGGLTLAAVNLMEQARELALHDDLTGLYGRHEYRRRLDEQISLCRRNKKVLGLIMCDMDHLKRFNDSYGHPAGDAALKAIAANIKTHLPADGVACRFGGEEFSVFIVGDSTDEVSEVAHILHRSIGETRLEVEDSLTVSVGWSILREKDTVQALIERADNACYQAKHNGRNQVVKADDV